MQQDNPRTLYKCQNKWIWKQKSNIGVILKGELVSCESASYKSWSCEPKQITNFKLQVYQFASCELQLDQDVSSELWVNQ